MTTIDLFMKDVASGTVIKKVVEGSGYTPPQPTGTSTSSSSSSSRTVSRSYVPSPNTTQFIIDIESGNVIKKVVESQGYVPPPTATVNVHQEGIQNQPTPNNIPVLISDITSGNVIRRVAEQSGTAPSNQQVYQNVYINYDKSIDTTRSNIIYIESLPPDTMVTFENGEPISREEALKVLRNQETNLVNERNQIQSYEQQGYTINYNPNTGTYDFTKTSTVVPEEQFDYNAWWYKREKELGPLVSIGKAITGGLGYIFNLDYWSAIARGEGAEFIHKTEYEMWKSTQKGDYISPWIKHQMPFYENVVIPFTIATGFTVALGALAKIGTGAIAVTGASAKVARGVQTAAGIVTKVGSATLLGTFVVGTGYTIGKTAAYEQYGKVPKGTTIGSIIGTSMQFTSAIGGYSFGKTIGTGKHIVSVQDRATGTEYIAGKNYFEFAGKKYYYGETVYGAKQLTPAKGTGLIPVDTGTSPTVQPIASASQVFNKWSFNQDMTVKPSKTVESTSIVLQGKDITAFTVSPKTFSFSYIKPITSILKTDIVSTKKGGYIIDLSKISEGNQLFETVSHIWDTKTLKKTTAIGIVEVKPTPTTVTDIVGSQAFGSFEVLPKKPLLPDLTKPWYSKDNRMLYETSYAKSISVSKHIGGEETVPTKYGLETVKTPEYDLSISRGLINDKVFFEDKSISFKPKEKPVQIIGDTKGLTLEQKNTFKTIGSILGGLSISQFTGLDIQSLSPFPSMVSKKGIITIGVEEQPVSSHWKDVLPTRQKSTQKFVFGLTGQNIKYGNIQGSKTDLNIINDSASIVKQDIRLGSINIVDTAKDQKTDLITNVKTIQEVNVRQKQIQDTKLDQILLQQLSLRPINIGGITSITSFNKSRVRLSLDLESPSKKQPVGKARSYYVLIKPFMDWPYQKASGPLSKQDALNTAHTLVGGHKQASFKLQPSSEKPVKPTGKQQKYKSNQYYYNKKKDIIVEKNKYRINSPGELSEITMKGIQARSSGLRMRGLII